MKRLITLAALAAILAAPVAAERVYTLDKALAAVAKGISSKLDEGAKTVIVEIKAETETGSETIANDLTLKLFEAGKLVMVDRQNLDAIRAELSFQASGEVSDESAQRLGAMLGAETLVTGSFERLNGNYRLTVKAVKVETAEIQYLSSALVSPDANTEAMLGRDPTKVAVAKKVGIAAKSVAGFSGRLACSVVNPIVGIGSFMQGDVKGGSRVAFWEVVGAGALAYGGYRVRNDQSNGELLAGTGGFILGAAVVYSVVRPWMYKRDPEVTKALDNINVSYSSQFDRGVRTVRVGYVYRY